MKIVCEACSAKYSISDDKVRGKVFKIRCKKCSHIIVVRGDANDAPAAESNVPEVSAPVAAPAADGQWYVVIDGEQVGPLTAADIADRVATGQVTGENFAWMEGMADWSQIASIPDLAGTLHSKARSLVPSAPPAEDDDSPFAPQPTAIMPAGQVEDMFRASDVATAKAAPAASAVKSVSLAAAAKAPAAAAKAPGHDLFAPQAAAEPEDQFSAAPTAVAQPSMGLGGFGAGAPLGGGGMFGNVAHEAPAPAAGAAGMTGQRSENSVLFSLSNLEALAAPKPVSSPSGGGGFGAGPGAPPSDGSGLIDIRAMASMTLGKPSSAPSFNSFGDLGGGSSGGGLSDFPSFSSAPLSPVNVPLLPGASASSGGMPKWVIAVIGVGVVFIGVLVFLIIKLSANPPTLAPVAEAPVTEPTAAAPSETPPPRAATPDPTPPPTPVAAAEPPPAAEPAAAPAEEPKAGSKSSSGSKHSGSGSKKPSSSKSEPAAAASAREPEKDPEPAAKPAPAPKKGGGDSLDDLLSGALGGSKPSAPSGGGSREPAAAPSAKKLGPLSKSDIVKVMSGVMPKAKACYEQYKVPGMANVNVKVEGSGKVSMATVSGKFAGTPSGDCVEKAIKSAKFPASDDGMTFPYPIPLR